MTGALIADTGGLLRALARTKSGDAAFPDFEAVLVSASRVLVPALVLAEVDYFLRSDRPVMRRLVAEIFDPATTYEYLPTLPEDVVRALVLDAKFTRLELGLVDGVVAAAAERTGVHRVLTADRRDFVPLRIGKRYEQRLQVVPGRPGNPSAHPDLLRRQRWRSAMSSLNRSRPA